MQRVYPNLQLVWMCGFAISLIAATPIISHAQALPKNVTVKAFYDINQVGMAKDKIKAIGMWEVPSLPGHFYILDQLGRIYSMYPSAGSTVERGIASSYTRSELADFRQVVNAHLPSEYGAYTIQFHPEFPKKNLFYLIYAGFKEGQKYENKLAPGGLVFLEEWEATGGQFKQIAKKRTILTFPHKESFGVSLMQFGPDGYLYAFLGDYKADSWNMNDWGRKLLRIDIDKKDPGKEYAVPPDNPFVNTPGVKPEIYANGFRNLWGIGFDLDGNLWASDVGQHIFEEMNFVKPGLNYGWSDGGNGEWYPNGDKYHFGPGFSGNCETAVKNGTTISKNLDCSKYENPYHVFPHSTQSDNTHIHCITNGAVYTGDKSSPFYGQYIFSDTRSSKLLALKKGGKPQFIGQAPNGFSSNTDGHDGIVHLTSDSYGNIFATMLSWYPNSKFREIYHLDHPQLKGAVNPTVGIRNIVRKPDWQQGMVIQPVVKHINGSSRFSFPNNTSKAEIYLANGTKVATVNRRGIDNYLGELPASIKASLVYLKFYE